MMTLEKEIQKRYFPSMQEYKPFRTDEGEDGPKARRKKALEARRREALGGGEKEKLGGTSGADPTDLKLEMERRRKPKREEL